MDAADVATVLDMTERKARDGFENRIVAGDTDRHLTGTPPGRYLVALGHIHARSHLADMS